MRHPDTAKLAGAALSASGAPSHREFLSLFHGAIGMRTFRAWLAGEQPAAPLAQLVLRNFITGWRPEHG